MNIEHFIARRIAITNSGSFTKMIIRIAIAAITVSLSVMILTTAVITGFKQEITHKIFGFWGHIHVTDSNINRNFELRPINKDDKYFGLIRDIKQIAYQSQAEILGIPMDGKISDQTTKGGVKGVHPYIILPGLMTSRSGFHGILLKGVDKNYNWDQMDKFIVEGKQLGFLPDSISNDILVSKNIADKLLIKTGDKVVLSFIRNNTQIKKRFTVCGLYNTGLEEYDKRFCIADLAKLQEILQWSASDVQGMEVVLEDVRDMDVISEYIYYEILPQQYYAESIRSKFPSIFEWLNLQDINEKIILQLMIVVAIINMVTVLLILILERTQMIGILKSLGMNNWRIRKIFIYNAGYIIFFGLLGGNILGVGICMLQKHFHFIKLDEANYYLDTAPVELQWWTLVTINIATFVITLLFLILPTYLVTRITPVKALRFD